MDDLSQSLRFPPLSALAEVASEVEVAAGSEEAIGEAIEVVVSVAVAVASAEEAGSEAVVTTLVEAAEEVAALADSEVAEEVVSATKAAAASVTVAVSATAAASMIVVASATAVALTTVVALAIVAASTTVAASATVVASVTAVVSITMLPATDLGALLQTGAQVGMKDHQVAASEEDKVEDQVGMALPEADTEQTSSAKAVLVGMTTEKPSVRAIRSPHRIPVVLRVRFNVYYMQRCKFQGLPRLFCWFV